MTVSTIEVWQPVAVIDRSRLLDRRLMRWVLAIAFLSGLFYTVSSRFDDVQQFDEEERIAIHLARGEGFLTPFDLSPNSPATSWCAPVYPGILAGVYHIFGIRSDASLLITRLLQVIFRTAAAAAILLIGRAWFSRAAGVLAACLFLLHPLFLRAMGFYWDNYLGLALFLWLLVWSISIRRRGARRFDSANLGFAMGLLMLTSAAYALTLPVLACIAAGFGAPGLGAKRVELATSPSNSNPVLRRLTFVAALSLAGAASLAPWTLRNYLTFGRLFFVRGNLNTELWIGNGPESNGWMTLAALDRHPSRDPLERRRVLEKGEIAYFQLCGERFREEYHAAPSLFWKRTGNRVLFAFIGFPFSGVHYPLLPNLRVSGVMVDRLLMNIIMVLLGLIGVRKACRENRREGLLLLLLGCLSLAPYAITQMYDRYTLPLNAILLLPAADLLTRLFQPLAMSRSNQSARWARYAPSMQSENTPLQAA